MTAKRKETRAPSACRPHRTAGITAAISAAALTTISAATFVQLTLEEVDFSEYPQWEGLVTVDVFAQFDDPDDSVVAGFGEYDHPAWLMTDSPNGFYNHWAGYDLPPNCALLDAFPELRWDTFVTIGLDCQEAGEEMIFLGPGFPPIEGSEWSIDNTVWYTTPDTGVGRAGDYPDLKVRIARITVDEGSTIDMMFNLQYLDPGGEPLAVYDQHLVYSPDDEDGDGIPDWLDNCPHHYNPDQEDCDDDGYGDVCTIDECPGDAWCDDCNFNDIPDECDIDDGTSEDCNGNGVPDECDIANGTSEDCQPNGIPDECDIASGTSQDCQPNGIPDECDIADGTSEDCQPNGIPDECDIADGTSEDINGNGIPDECECPADFDGDGDVDTADLLFLLGAWGTPDGDVDGDGDTDTADLLALLGAWGECPE